MEFRQKVLDYFEKHRIPVSRVEQEGETPSIVLHVSPSDNIKIANLREVMETVLTVQVVQSDLGGMNVVIVEDNSPNKEE